MAKTPEQPPENYDTSLCWPTKWAIAYGSDYNSGHQCGTLRVYFVYDSYAEAEVALRRMYNLPPSSLISDVSHGAIIREMKWTERESIKEYVKPVWAHEKFWLENEHIHKLHFVHKSTKNPDLLAYTPDNNKGMRDIQVMIKPGKYLQRYFSEILTEKEILFYSEWQATGTRKSSYQSCEVKFAATAEEIEFVYLNGPSSCMSCPIKDFGTDYRLPAHPTTVYAAGDLQIAYMEFPENHSKSGRICARALVWPDKKVYSRVYPTTNMYVRDGFTSEDESIAARQAFTLKLRALGYEEGSLQGAKLLKIKIRSDKYLMPYLDKEYYFRDAGKHFVISTTGTRTQKPSRSAVS